MHLSEHSHAQTEDAYENLLIELPSLLEGETNQTARYATCASLLAQAFKPRFFWTGFYLVDPVKPDELVVGPYQGTLGCMRIPFGKGVCGVAAAERKTQLVPDVHAFPGHIACDSRSKSEIVVPIFAEDGALAGVLDVDSTELNAFGETDQNYLEKLMQGLVI
ncbi:MAG: GAF domain-containing protein [Pseudomonadota bacterium]